MPWDQTIREAIAILSRFNLGGLVVTDEAGSPVGIITERDIVRQAAKDEALFSGPVREVMTIDVITATPEDDVESVARTMMERQFRHMPVMDQGRLVGIVSSGDVLKAQRDRSRGEADTLHTQLIDGR